MKKKKAGGLKVYVESGLFCPPRHLEAERLRRYFRRNGAALVPSPEKADIKVLNTCAVLESEEKRSLARVRELDRLPGRLIVVGCLKYISGRTFRKTFGGAAFAPKELDRIDSLFPDFRHKFSGEEDAGSWPEACVPEAFTRQKDAADRGSAGHWFVYASQGCELRPHCSYCAIWKSTGPYRSKPLADCAAEVRRGAGRPTIHLMDSGAYGTDIGLAYPDLLRAALGAAGGSGLFLHSLNPKWVFRHLRAIAELVRGGGVKAIRFSHESGSDRILRLMRRPYTAAQGLECVLALKKARPGLKVMTQFIAGFPGETEKDFDRTVDLLRRGGFDDMEVFPFSPRPGTPAASMPGRVSEAVVRARIARLHAANKGDLGL